MSAIAGVINFDARPDSAVEVKQMLSALAFWGHDGQHTWQREGVALGHRLRISTPEDHFESLPLINIEHQFALTAACRLDNRDELFTSLKIPVSQQTNMPDGELMLRAWLHWGDDCARHLLGDFSLAVWDWGKQRLFLACDFLGKMPLWYYRKGPRFVFATQAKGLFALADIPYELDAAAWLAPSRCMAGDTAYTPSIYKHIEYLRGGYSLTVDRNGIQQHQYWDVTNLPEVHYKNDAQYHEAFRDIFSNAVRSRLRSAHPIGVMLSGGLDSSAVACVAARQLREQGKPLYAFSYRPIKADYRMSHDRIPDELAYINAVVEQEDNIELFTASAADKNLLDYAERFIHYGEAPPHLRDDWTAMLWEHAETKGIKNMLNGNMGNFSFSYTGGNTLAHSFIQGRWSQTLKELSLLQQNTGASLGFLLKNKLLVPLLPKAIWGAYRLLKHGTSRLGNRYVRTEALKMSRWRKLACSYQRLGKNEPINGRTSLNNAWKVRNTNRNHGIGTAKAQGFGLTTLDPTSDRRLIEFCLRLPDRLYARDGQSRLLVREGMAGILPPEIQQRHHRGLQSCDTIQRTVLANQQLQQAINQLAASSMVTEIMDIERIADEVQTIINSNPKDIGHQRGWDLWQAILLAKFLQAQER